MEEEGEAIELEPSLTVEEESEPNNLESSLIVKEGEGAHFGLDIQNEISRLGQSRQKEAVGDAE
ncbi:hypothetical protein Scep_018701 [Stephania cephalantha]|uniref:Uncharacterized protein n=1 Tax=Stephania cephalantha TaxID=152367 RepID=A0AAP0I9L2_9MAGN